MNSFRKTFLGLASLIFATSTAVSCFAADAAKTRVALDWVAEPEFGGFYAAKNLDLVPGGAGAPVVQMVGAGKFDFGTVSGAELVLAQDRGSDVVAIFATYQNAPTAIMTHEERGFKNLEDVFKTEGTLALGQGQPFVAFLQKKYAPIKAQIVPYMGGIAEFLHNPKYSQQGFIFSEPVLARRQNAKPKSFLIADSGFNPYVTVVVTRREVIEKKPALVKTLVEALRAGWASYLKDPKPTNLAMSKINKSMDLQTFDEGAQAQASLIQTADTKRSGLGSMTESRWKTLADQLADLKLIAKPKPASTYFKNF